MSSENARKEIDSLVDSGRPLTEADHARIRQLQLIIARNTLAVG